MTLVKQSGVGRYRRWATLHGLVTVLGLACQPVTKPPPAEDSPQHPPPQQAPASPQPSPPPAPQPKVPRPDCSGPLAFPDSAVATAVREALDTNEGKRPELLGARALDGLLELQITDAVDLSGLECATRLETLELYGSEVTVLTPIRHLLRLTQLRIDAKTAPHLSDLPVRLAYFEARGAGITTLRDLPRHDHLVGIALSNNAITDLSALVRAPRLSAVHVDGNPVTDLSPLASLPKLEVLDISSTGTTSLASLKSLTRLTELYASDNAIEDLSPLAGLVDMVILQLDNNEITDITPLASMTQLTSVSLSNNEITDVTPLRDLADLDEIGLGHNIIRTLAPLIDSEWSRCWELDVRDNPLSAKTLWVDLPVLCGGAKSPDDDFDGNVFWDRGSCEAVLCTQHAFPY